MKKLLSILLALFILQVPTFAFANTTAPKARQIEITEPAALKVDESQLTAQEVQTFSKIEDSLKYNADTVQALEEKGVLDDYLNDIQAQMRVVTQENANDILSTIADWNIQPQDTVSEVAEMAQQCLNNQFGGIKIGSTAFENLIDKWIGTDAGIEKMVQDDPTLGPLYVFMCIYDAYVLEDDSVLKTYSTVQDISNIANMTMEEIAYTDGEENFVNTNVTQTLNQYAQVYAASSAWPKMNGNKIQVFAQNWALGYNSSFITLDKNSDCTNFASQALYNGLLPMTYTTSDKNANGIVNTKARWFHFKTSSSKYSISTSWIRVVELYDYLSPHYAVFETTSGSTMSPYLNIGFLIQGKPLIGSYKHSAIITKYNGKLCYCAHSSNRKNEPIQTFYDGFHKYRVVQTY